MLNKSVLLTVNQREEREESRTFNF